MNRSPPFATLLRRSADLGLINRYAALQHHFDRVAHREVNFGPTREQDSGQSKRATAEGPNTCTFRTSSNGPDPRPRYGRADDGASVLSLTAFSLNGPFLVFDACGVLIAGCSLHSTRQQQGIAVGEDHGGKAHLQFGAALDLARTLHPPDFSLHEGTGWNHDVVVHHDGKRGLRVNRIAWTGVLGGKALLHDEGNSRARGDRDRVGGSGEAVLLHARSRPRGELGDR